MPDSALYTQDFTRLLPGGAKGASSSITLYKLLFWTIALILNGALSYILFSMNRQISSVLVFLALLFMTYFYYVKLFIVNKQQWPPITTMCPDYLTLIRTPASNGNPASQTCVDFVGVSSNGGLQKCNPSDVEVCKSNALQHFDPVAAGETPSNVQDRLLSAGLIWTSVFGDV